MSEQAKRYLLNNDDDGHWYLVPESDQEAFTAWVYEDGPEVPSVLSLGSHPNTVTFEAPLHFGKQP